MSNALLITLNKEIDIEEFKLISNTASSCVVWSPEDRHVHVCCPKSACVARNWRYVALVIVLWRPALSASSSSSASVTALR